jgi:hypothetical protein
MSFPALTPFTDRPDYSSVGASPISSIEQCYPLRFDSDDQSDQLDMVRYVTFPICSQSDGMQAFVGVCVPEEADGLQLSEAQMSRLFCHFLLQQLPDLAFEEAVDSLTGMYEFYRESLTALPALTPPNQSVKARITGTHTAPVYPVTEE